jgi:AcrR family transcriptional regulator
MATQVRTEDPRVLRTRKLLKDALCDLLAEKSFQAVTVQDVAERATVNRATFYAHYVDKFDLLEHFVGDMFRDALEQALPATSACTTENLRQLVATVLNFLARFHDHCKPGVSDLQPFIEARVQRELQAFLLEWLRRLPDGDPLRGVRPEMSATVLSWAIFGAGVEFARAGDRTEDAASRRATEVLDALLHGLVGGRA